MAGWHPPRTHITAPTSRRGQALSHHVSVWLEERVVREWTRQPVGGGPRGPLDDRSVGSALVRPCITVSEQQPKPQAVFREVCAEKCRLTVGEGSRGHVRPGTEWY